MPFSPVRLLIAYEDSHGLCEAVVPRMRRMLEERAFEVDVHRIESDSGAELASYRGVVLGAAAGLRGAGPSERVAAWVRASEDLGEKKLALFSVYAVREGGVLHRLRQITESTGAEVVVAQAYWRLWLDRAEHVLPAECMVRIRR